MNSQQSSPAPQFKSINSSALSLLYCPALISVHDYWENYSSDYVGLCYIEMDKWNPGGVNSSSLRACVGR